MSTIKVDTVRPVTADASLTLQGDSGGSGVTGLTIDSSGVFNTTTAKVTNIQATSGQSLTIKDEDGNAAITIGTDNTAASYLSLNFGSYHGDSGGVGSGSLSANTLNDYEIGAWQPAFTHSGTSGSVTAATMTAATQATYVKIGNIVTLFIPALTITANTALPSGSSLYLGGFPFQIANSAPFATGNYNGGGFSTTRNSWTTAAPDFLRCFSGQTRGGLYAHTSTGISTIQTQYAPANAYLEMVIIYPTN